ncbi:hypothetical protein CCACVL1_15717 [Corchorus capsularis]|uniref:Gnk2-homologous domain-containing protein n=1 Tax=Corchorus capsularis TaxID=210143 RepID=A0A1R3I193_COCAP|nr:hypothetical protein CCACVL1_15717 [Corchorus capsularis]
MESSRLSFLFLLIVSIQLCAMITNVQSNKLYQLCSFSSNFTVNSTYGNNLNHLLSTITSDTQINHGFYNLSYGQNPDKVNAIGLCRGDVKPDSCRSCITNSTVEFTKLCPTQKRAIVWYDECMLRTQAASGDSLRKFATGNANSSDSETIYASAQCTPDLSRVECGANSGLQVMGIVATVIPSLILHYFVF